jgi:hypothetical protein
MTTLRKSLRKNSKLVLAALLACAAGCATRTVVIDSQNDVVRLGKGVRGPVYVWQNGQWVLVGKTTLPEGWYAGPGPAAKK